MTDMLIETVSVYDLKLDPKNARKHDKKNLLAMQNSLGKFGQQKPIVVDRDNVVIAGNGMLMAARALGVGSLKVKRFEGTKDEALAYALADNRTAELSEWDTEILRESLRELNEINFDVGEIGFDLRDFGMLGISEGDESDSDDSYTKKITIPIYEPRGEKPEVSQLFNFEKSTKLIFEIEESDLSYEEREFLKLAAYRHVVFSYQDIAEYYAHASPKVQDLMEKSALVIIDFDKAIENGFVRMSEEIAEGFKHGE
jgi:hypothetical protein